MIKLENKKAVLRIIEAFIAVLIILGVVLIVVSKQKVSIDNSEEMADLQKNILDYISEDEALRAMVLEKNSAGVAREIKQFIPAGINYAVNICASDELCPNPAVREVAQAGKEVISRDKLIAANLTFYNPNSIPKVKLFFWESCRDGSCDFVNYTEPVVEVPKKAEVTLDISNIVYYTKTNVNIGGTVYALVHYYNHTRTFEDKNQVGATLTSGQLCEIYKGCQTSTVSYVLNASNNYKLIQYNKQFYTASGDSNPNNDPNNFTLSYTGTDLNGNSVNAMKILHTNASQYWF